MLLAGDTSVEKLRRNINGVTARPGDHTRTEIVCTIK